MHDLGKIDPKTLNHTESGIMAFLNYYGVVNSKSITHFFGMTPDTRSEMEKKLLGKTFPQLCKERKEYLEYAIGKVYQLKNKLVYRSDPIPSPPEKNNSQKNIDDNEWITTLYNSISNRPESNIIKNVLKSFLSYLVTLFGTVDQLNKSSIAIMKQNE